MVSSIEGYPNEVLIALFVLVSSIVGMVVTYPNYVELMSDQ